MSLPPPNALAHFAWAFGSLFFFYAFVQRVAPSVMVEDLMRDFAVGGAIVGNLSAFYFYAYAGLQIPIGVLMDRVGPRRLMSAAALLCGAGGMLFATFLGLLLIPVFFVTVRRVLGERLDDPAPAAKPGGGGTLPPAAG